LLAEQIALDVIADEIVMRGGSEAVSNNANWQSGHRAILDDSICRKRPYVNRDDVGEII
jgi:hypothetical protein